MDFSEYFDPVSLDRPASNHLSDKAVFCRNIYIHTPDRPVRNLDSCQLAILGVPEDRNAGQTGTAGGPDQIRNYLYQLYRIHSKLKIIDMGNLKPGKTVQDTYYALADVLMDLIPRDISVLVLGGSQDLTYGIYLAFERGNRKFNFATIDSRLDMGLIEDEIRPESYLIPILSRKKELLFNYINIGHQTHFTDPADIDFLKDNFFQTLRIGEVRQDLSSVEPYFRDASFISMDLSAIRQSDAPGCSHPSPNGFTGEEACQLSRYAGHSSATRTFGIFNLLPASDQGGQTAHLAAQAAWYFMDGLSQRKQEHPNQSPDRFKKFIVSLNEMDHDIIFHKSLDTERWWFEVPVLGRSRQRHMLISCSHEDYLKACSHEIPDRWLNAFQKLN